MLTHTAGFPLAPLGYPQMTDRAQRLEAFARWRLTYEPGTQLRYHLTSAGWVVAEIVERRTGRALAEYLREEIAGPLGLDLELGVPVERQRQTVAPFVPVADAVAGEGDHRERDPWGPWFLANPEVIATGEPSHSVVATAAAAALHYQALFRSGLWTREAAFFKKHLGGPVTR